MCMAICSYAQRDIPAGGSMEVASVEKEDTFGDHVGTGKELHLYKVKDLEGNPRFFLFISRTVVSFTFGTVDSFSTFSIPGETVALDFGATYQDAMGKLDALAEMFAMNDGDQKELPGRDGSPVLCTLKKGILGKHLDIAETSISKSDIKSLKFSFKISKKLHPDL